MVQIVAGASIALRFDQFDLTSLLDGDITSRSDLNLVVDMHGGEVSTLTGTGFNLSGAPTSGTISGVQATLNGTTEFTITGMSTAVSDFAGYNASAAYVAIFSGNDNLTGSTLGDYLQGFGGHDNLFGGAGADELGGGDGNDHLYGQSSNGGPDGADLIHGDEGSDYLQGNAGNDTLEGGTGSDRINGGANDDLIIGGDGNDTVNGNLGSDTIDGGDDNDSLRGGQGNDSIIGGDGNDLISGDLGSDTLAGGNGIDMFVFSAPASTLAAGADKITDFQDGVDHIALGFIPALLAAGSAQTDLNSATSVAQQMFDSHGGDHEAVAMSVGGQFYLFYAGNGGATVDSAIQLSNLSSAGTITTDDFILV